MEIEIIEDIHVRFEQIIARYLGACMNVQHICICMHIYAYIYIYIFIAKGLDFSLQFST